MLFFSLLAQAFALFGLYLKYFPKSVATFFNNLFYALTSLFHTSLSLEDLRILFMKNILLGSQSIDEQSC